MAIFLTVYYNPEKAWDGARTLHELLVMDVQEETIGAFINNYKINLFDFHEYDDFSNFSEPLETFFGFLRYCTEKETLQRYMEQAMEVLEIPAEKQGIYLEQIKTRNHI